MELKFLVGTIVTFNLIGLSRFEPTPFPQLDLPPITTSTASPQLSAPATPSPITISDKNVDLVQPNSYAGEDFDSQDGEGQHPIGDFESDRSNRGGPPYDDESDYYNRNHNNPWVR